MAPYLQYLIDTEFKHFNAITHADLLKKMTSANEQKLKELDDKITDAEENFGESEVREALLTKSQYFASIGDKERALAAYRITTDKTVSLGHRLDIVFAVLRIAFAFNDIDLVKRNIEKAKRYVCNTIIGCLPVYLRVHVLQTDQSVESVERREIIC